MRVLNAKQLNNELRVRSDIEDIKKKSIVSYIACRNHEGAQSEQGERVMED